jgi:hypothetical protein
VPGPAYFLGNYSVRSAVHPRRFRLNKYRPRPEIQGAPPSHAPAAVISVPFFPADTASVFFAFHLAHPDDQGFSALFLFKIGLLDYDILDTKQLLE